jgi:hypothetical protein
MILGESGKQDTSVGEDGGNEQGEGLDHAQSTV